MKCEVMNANHSYAKLEETWYPWFGIRKEKSGKPWEE